MIEGIDQDEEKEITLGHWGTFLVIATLISALGWYTVHTLEEAKSQQVDPQHEKMLPAPGTKKMVKVWVVEEKHGELVGMYDDENGQRQMATWRDKRYTDDGYLMLPEPTK